MKLARLCTLIALVVALGLPAMPAAAKHGAGAATAAAATHAGMDCPSHGQQPKPPHHSPGAPDCCATALCGMALGLPAVAVAAAIEPPHDRGKYAVLALPRPVGIDPPPTTQPPKAAA